MGVAVGAAVVLLAGLAAIGTSAEAQAPLFEGPSEGYFLLPMKDILLEVHPNERAFGPGGGPKIGTAPWSPSGLGPGAWYQWKKYIFGGGDDLWIDVCAQCFNWAQNAVGQADNLQLSIDGVIPNDVWGIQSGPLGAWQWRGNTDNGNRLTLRFNVSGLQAGQHTLKIMADETPIIWWIKVWEMGYPEVMIEDWHWLYEYPYLPQE
jgi:hypothetical protein